MTDTGIFIRAKLGDKWDSVDIGDPRLDAEQLLRWLASKDNTYVLQVIRIVKGEAPKEQDEGGLTFAISVEDGQVRVDFGKKIEWFAMSPKEALQFGAAVAGKAMSILKFMHQTGENIQ